jgi:hypothetical protein
MRGLLDTLDHLAARLARDGDPEPIDIEFLLPCFVRYPPVEVCLDLGSRGTVIDGRTGSGKTAILKYILSTVEHASEIDPFDMSMSYVSNSDVLSFLYAIGADLDLLFQVLWKHVLCIEFIRMRFSVNSEESSRGVFGWYRKDRKGCQGRARRRDR